MAEEPRMEQSRETPEGEVLAGRLKKPTLAQEIYQYITSMVSVLITLILMFTFVARLPSAPRTMGLTV